MKQQLLVLLFLPVLIQTQNAFGQDSSSKVSVLFSTALFVPVSVAIQGGIQYRLNQRLSLLLEGAYPTFYPDNDYEKISYWRSGIGFRIHSPGGSLNGKYYGFQLNYLYRELFDKDEGVVHGRDGVYRYDEAIIKSPVLSFALIVGKELTIVKGKSFADVFLGLGVRRIFNHYEAKNLRITSIDTPPDDFDWLLPSEGWRFNYPLTRLHVTTGIRFGLRM